MNFLNRNGLSNDFHQEEDPVSSVANLFDVSIVFIVALFFALFMTYKMLDFFNPDSELTITKKNPDGTIQIITKKGKEVKIEKVTPSEEEGRGVRLGTAYQLEDGKIIYVPEK
ncbi:DUF2149 domain-containing protein [Flammeovirgaceae bacterium SG7u.111]|nr:DUF2149 domain-containing protein [Flammeovirgaceae bacterium SG7u.132]WPO37774.1 DUF2149 domain-containing protein [Flammeovirgaceae bacterium SG7u.111]